MKNERVSKVLELMKEQELSQMIISNPAAIFYLTGKWFHPGERLVALYLNGNGNHKFFNNELFPITEDMGVEIVWYNDTQNPIAKMKDYLDSSKAMGIDGEWPSKFLLKLMDACSCPKFVNGSLIVDTVRMQKDDAEKDFMRESSRLNDLAMEALQSEIKEGVTEKQLMTRLQEIYAEIGSDGFSFNPIIGFGGNAADPHYATGNAVVKSGDSIVLDIGCVKDSYISDMTRTVFFKEATEKGKEIYEIVKSAQLKAIDAVKPGVRFCDVDAAARGYITEKGYGKFFTHRTGHSAGIEVHDYGDVSAVNEDILKPGMIFSIEPGIYLTGEVGVRIEDLVLVTETGCEVLNKVSKDMKIVG